MEEQQTPAEKDTPLSSQVLEYYRNYSQSVQLPRYLCGEVSNASVISELMQEQREYGDIQSYNMVRRPPLIGQDHAMTDVVPPTIIITDINSDNRGQVSPTSSVASNRKLEWDNGADIGYENCEVANRSLFRSCSLPALNTLERNIQKDFLRHSPDGRIAEMPQNNIASKNSDLSTDCTTKIPLNLTSSITAISNDDQNRRASSSGQSSSIIVSSKPRENVYTSTSSSEFDKSNIIDIIYIPVLVNSAPLAESTPNMSEKQSSIDTIYHETPVLTHPRKPPRKNAIFIQPKTPTKSKSSSFDDLQNLQKLDETLVNRNKYFQKYLIQKQQNLCITKPASVEYIVNKSLKDNISIAIQTENVQSPKRELIYLDPYISDKEESSSSDNSSKIVDCNSFEYLYGSTIVQKKKSECFEGIVPIEVPPADKAQANNQIANVQEIVQKIFPNELKHSKAKSDLTNISSTETVSSELKSEKISLKLSKNLISDVEKSVDLLTRLLSSKKYNEGAKKYYIRKIVRKIVDSKYIDDKTSMTSSSGTNKTTNESSTSEVTEEKYQKQSKIEPPLILAQRQIKSESNLQDMTDIYPRLQRNPRFTLTNNEFFVGHNKGDDNDNSSSDLFRPHSRHVFPSYTTDSSIDKIQYTNCSSQSWKDDKTASERLIESQTPITENSDELVGFAQRERQSQLNWISNEINHLSKLKSLLEKKEQKPGTTQSTAVYMITTDKNSNKSSKQSCNCNNRLNIPNVVSVRKTSGHHHIKLQHCDHNQQEYKVKQVHCDRNQCNHRETTLSCPCHQQYTRNYQRTVLSSTSAMPTSSEDQQKPSISTYKAQTVPKQNSQEEKLQEDIDLGIKNPECNSTGVNCNLLRTRAAIVASEQAQNLPNVQRNMKQSVCYQNKEKVTILPKSTSAPTSPSSSPKRRSEKNSVKSKFSNRNVPTISPKEEIIGSCRDIANNARLISSELYQSNECPTTSVRRYVFEIPIVDLQSHQDDLIKKKSSNFGVNKREITPVHNIDFEVRNIHLSQNSKDKQNGRRDSIIEDQKKQLTNDKDNEIRQLKHSGSEETPMSLSGIELSHNQVASSEIGPSISRNLVSESSDKFNSLGTSSLKSRTDTIKSSLVATTSILSKEPVTINASERNKIIQTIEVRLKEDQEVTDSQEERSKKGGARDNEGLKRSTGSQTLSLENYMKKLIADTMESDNWSRSKFSSDLPKTTDSYKQGIVQHKVHALNNISRKSDPYTRRKLHEKDLQADSSTDEHQHSPKYQQSSSNDQHGYTSDTFQLAYTRGLPDSIERIIDGNVSSAVFVPKPANNFHKVDRIENYVMKDRSLETRQKNKSSEEYIISIPKGTKNKDLPDAVMMVSNAVEGTFEGSDNKNTSFQEISKKEKSNPQVLKNTEGQLDYDKKKPIPKEIDDSRSNSSESKIISDTSSATTSMDETIKICQCCRTNNISLDNIFAQAIHHPLCQTCFQIHQYSLWKNRQPFYMYPHHICNCYTLLKTEQIQAIKNTINELQNLECNKSNSCVCPPNIKTHQQDNKCLNCNRPLKSTKHHHTSTKIRKPPIKSHGNDGRHKQGGISYTLKLETATEEDIGKVKAEETILDRYEEEVILKIPNRRGRTASLDTGKKSGSWKEKENDTLEREKENDEGMSNKKPKKNKTKISKTLQEYLSTNRPTFIESAEQRRKCLIELAYMREERCQKYKQLLAMTNGVPVMPNGQNTQNNGFTIQKPRIFSTKEMKRLTAKNYKKLPEVQQRLLDNKERQLKKANRLLSDIFNKKLRDKVLKGQPSLSTSVSVINLM